MHDLCTLRRTGMQADLKTHGLRPVQPADHDALREIYLEAVQHAEPALYSAAQCRAWSRWADQLRGSLQRGQGLVSCAADGRAEAFGLRDPADRIALLYCHPRSQRQGRARQLLRALERQALAAGCSHLRTEASLLSQPLFSAEGWRVSWREALLIEGVPFRRFRMHKQLRAN
jgi:GNAT superfamily N-acetyltransferase